MTVNAGKVLITCDECKPELFGPNDTFNLIALRGNLDIWICKHQKAYTESKKIQWVRCDK